MRTLHVLWKTLREQVREWPSLAMVLALCPLFVFLYWLMSGGGTTSYRILLLDRDRGGIARDGGLARHGARVEEALRGLRAPGGAALVRLEKVGDEAAAVAQLKDRQAAALLVVPERFTEALEGRREPGDTSAVAVTVSGDAANPAYAVASILALTAADQVVRALSGTAPPVDWREEFVSGNAPRSEFETYVPGLLVLSIMLLVFTTALPLVREREDRTLRRLRLSRMTAFDLLAGVGLAQAVIGAAAVALTFVTARALGFRSEGPLWAAVVIGVWTAGSVVAVGLLTACFCKNATAVLTVGTLPFFLLMWFTGAAMPMPMPELFTAWGRTFPVNAVLPPTHAVVALNKVLSFGASLGDVGFEMGAMTVLNAAYFVLAVAVFQRTQMRTQ
jgi:ABC-2 type transport system permease protein